MRANNFTEADLPKLMEFLHRRGVKGYVTFNTLVFENELAEAEQYLRTIIAAGVDAAIVQDVGICRLIRRLSPDFPIHASTQMTITSAAGVEFARELGCNLVVLARECSLKEIESDTGLIQTRAPQPPSTAPAVAPGSLRPRRPLRRLLRPMSHQRGARRPLGQSRRMRPGLPHALRTDLRRQTRPARRPEIPPQPAGPRRPGTVAGTGPRRASPRSRSRAGSSRPNTSPTSRASTARRWMSYCRRARASNVRLDSSPSLWLSASTPTLTYEMEMAFSRGLYTGWFRRHQQPGTGPCPLRQEARRLSRRGHRVLRDGVADQLEGPLKPGDGVVFDAGKPEEQEEGGRVYEIRNAEIRSSEQDRRSKPVSFASVTATLISSAFTSATSCGRPATRSWTGACARVLQATRRSFSARSSLKFTAGRAAADAHRARRIGPHARASNPPCRWPTRRSSRSRPSACASNSAGSAARRSSSANWRTCCEGDVLLPVSELNRLRREAGSASWNAQRAQPAAVDTASSEPREPRSPRTRLARSATVRCSASAL